jgi:hypothetical protein
VRARVDRIREGLVLFMTDDDNQTGQVPFSVLVRTVRSVVSDERTVRKYVQHILPGLGLIEPLNGRIIQVSPRWILAKVVVQA